jgi:hypothetical protein
MVFDTQTLTRVIERSFELAGHGDVSPEERAGYLQHGKRLREQLVHLLGARFDAESAEFRQATDALHQTNHALTEASEDLEKASAALHRLAELVGHLDVALRAVGRL